MKIPKIKNKPILISGEQTFVPTPPEAAQQTRPLGVDDTNGKTLFDLQTEHDMGFNTAPNDLGRFAIAYQSRGMLENSATNISNLIEK